MNQAQSGMPAIASHAFVGFWSMDAASWTVTLDEPLSRFLDVGEGERGVPFERAVAGLDAADQAALRAGLQAAIDRCGPVTRSQRILSGRRSGHQVQIVGRCFADREGRAAHLAGVIIDIGPDVGAQFRHERIIEGLMSARRHAVRIDGDILLRLIDAVLLEAGRQLSRTHAQVGGD